MALPIDGATGGTPGSPMPEGAAVDFYSIIQTVTSRAPIVQSVAYR
jgi:hypothetical protein